MKNRGTKTFVIPVPPPVSPTETFSTTAPVTVARYQNYKTTPGEASPPCGIHKAMQLTPKEGVNDH